MKRIERMNIYRTIHYSFILSPVSIRQVVINAKLQSCFYRLATSWQQQCSKLIFHANFIPLLQIKAFEVNYQQIFSAIFIAFIIIPFIEIYSNKSSLMI